MYIFNFPRTTICAFLCMVAGLAIGYLATWTLSQPEGIDGYDAYFMVFKLSLVGVAVLLGTNAGLHGKLGHGDRFTITLLGAVAMGLWGVCGLLLTNLSHAFRNEVVQHNELAAIAVAFFLSGAFVVITNLRTKQEIAAAA